MRALCAVRDDTHTERESAGGRMDDLPGAKYGGAHDISHLLEHLRWMRRAGRADRTIEMRRANLVYLYEHLGHDPLTATEAELEAWQDSMPRTAIRQKTSLIRPYFSWAQAKGYRTDNPAALLVTPRARRGIPAPIPVADLMRAVELAPPRILPWLLLAAWSGLRAKEIAGLQYADFEHVGGRTFLRLTVTKGSAPRTGVVPGWAWATMRPMLRAGDRSARLPTVE